MSNIFKATIDTKDGTTYADLNIFKRGRFQPKYRVQYLGNTGDNEMEVRALAEDIARHGQHNPVTAIRLAEKVELTTTAQFHGHLVENSPGDGFAYEDNAAELVTGHRRIAALHLIQRDGSLRRIWNERTGGVPVWAKVEFVDPSTSDRQILVRQFAENFLREDYNFFELGEQLHLLKTVGLLTQQEIGEKLGRSQVWVSQYIRFATNPVIKQVYEEWATGQIGRGGATVTAGCYEPATPANFITPSNAEAIINEKLDAEQQLLLLRRAISREWPRTRIRRAVKATLAGLEEKEVEQVVALDEGTKQTEARAKAVAREKQIAEEKREAGDEEAAREAEKAASVIASGDVPIIGDERPHTIGAIARNQGGTEDKPAKKKRPQFTEEQAPIAKGIQGAIKLTQKAVQAWEAGAFGEGHDVWFKDKAEKLAELAGDLIIACDEKRRDREYVDDEPPLKVSAELPASTDVQKESEPEVETETTDDYVNVTKFTPSEPSPPKAPRDENDDVLFVAPGSDEPKKVELREDGRPK